MLGFLKNLTSSNNDLSVTMKVRVWSKQTHDLYDYHVEPAEKQKYLLSKQTFLLLDKKNGKIQFSNEQFDTPNINQSQKYIMGSINPLFFQNGQSTFIFNPIRILDKQNVQYAKIIQGNPKIVDSYIVLHKEKNKGASHKLSINDIFKLGMTTFKVKNVSSVASKERSLLPIISAHGRQEVYNCTEKIKGTCKICLMEEDPQEQMISPCNCKGSCSCVHISCLKQWIASRGNIRNGSKVQTLDYSKLNCEICKKNYPDRVIVKGKQQSLYYLENPKNPFIILETLCKLPEQKSIFVLSPNQQQHIKIGRGQNSNVRIQSDRSMSKIHSLVTLKNGQFYLSDNDSKFGTLVKIDKAVDLKKNSFIQGGRFMFQFKYFSH